MKVNVKREILDFIHSVAGKDLKSGVKTAVPCDLYDEIIQTGFIVHGFPGENPELHSPSHYGLLADLADKANIRLIQIWEDLWQVKKPVIRSRLRSVYGKTKRIFARKTLIHAIDLIESNKFLEKNHLQGGAKAGFKYGLFSGGELVAVATFSKGRQVKRDGIAFRSYELIRYCSKLNTTVVGGVDKLLKHFIKEKHPDDIMTYADRDWSNGSVYEKLGFMKKETVPPQTFWVDPVAGIRVFPNKINDLLIEKGWSSERDKTSDPEMILRSHGFKAVYNSGSIKLVLMLRTGF